MFQMLKLTGTLLLFTLAFLPRLYIHHFYIETVFIPGRSNQDKISADELFAHKPSVGLRRGKSRGSHSSRDPECSMAADRRFDCARDKPVSRSQCEQRGCCYVPVSASPGPPWCFYPRLYSGYRMGPLSPSEHGQTATLTRAAPSYLPRDVPVLRLDVAEAAADCLHITVSTRLVLSKHVSFVLKIFTAGCKNHFNWNIVFHSMLQGLS